MRAVAAMTTSAMVAAMLTVAASPAFAIAPVSASGGAGSGKIVMPTVERAAHSESAIRNAAAAVEPPLKYRGGNSHGIGVVTGTPKVYLVFWGSQWGSTGTDSDGNTTFSGDNAGVAPRLQQLFKGIGTHGEQWSGVLTQYCEGVAAGATACTSTAARVAMPTNAVYADIWYDGGSVAPANASYGQLAAEADAAATHFANTTLSANRNTQYFIVSPTGTHPDGFNTQNGQFCAYHSMAQTARGDIAFTNMPYVPDMTWQCGANFVNAGGSGAIDGVSLVAGHEYAETMSDPSAYAGWLDKNGEENADKCAWNGRGGTTGSQNVDFDTGSLPMTATWGNDLGACEISRVPDPVNDFFVTAAPATTTLYQATTAPITVATTTARGSAQSVALSVSGLPTGVSASFGASTVTSETSTTMTLTATANATPGTYTITVTGAGSSFSRTVTAKVVVSQRKDFTLATADSVTVQQAKTAGVTVTTTSAGATGDKVRVTVSGLPTGVTASISPAIVTAGSTTRVTLKAATFAPLGDATITVTGTGISYTHSTTFTATVAPADDFSIALSPASLTIAPGGTGTSTLSSTVTVGGAQALSLSASAPTGLRATFSPTSTTSGGATSTLTIAVGARTRAATYTVRITARGPSRTQTTTLTVVVPGGNPLRSPLFIHWF